MMKGSLSVQQQQQQQPQYLVEENMSNLTSASNEASGSSVSRNVSDNGGSIYQQQQQYFAPQNQANQQPQPPPVKKKRNLPGNPDPEAEVLALSPKTLMATNRFVCEICSKGFQRDQNLQLHRRGHNLPWKLKQRANKDVIRKKVYVCPEASCVHHDPSRALGDLTGIKKHFCRKHGEKKWKCDKCSKRYAVQSDWKAHSKTCGTREYRCDCGTLFSRRDSFITHRAFCDALAEESARGSIPGNQILSSQTAGSSSTSHGNNVVIPLHQPQFSSQEMPHLFSLKKEQHTFNLRPEIPPWLACSPGAATGAAGPGPPPPPMDLASSIFQPTRMNQEFTESHRHHHQEFLGHENPNPSCSLGPNLLPFHPATSSHISATALLQKAAQMGATMSSNKAAGSAAAAVHAMLRPHQGHHVSADSGFGLNLSSRDQELVNGLAAFGNKAADSAAGAGASDSTSGPPPPPPPPAAASPSLLQDMNMIMTSLSSATTTTGFEGSTFVDALGGILVNQKKDSNFMNLNFSKTSNNISFEGAAAAAANDGMTRDFLGLRPLSQSEIFSIANLGNCMSSASNEHPNTSQESWQQQG